jgi:hypothetical protein
VGFWYKARNHHEIATVFIPPVFIPHNIDIDRFLHRRAVGRTAGQ